MASKTKFKASEIALQNAAEEEILKFKGSTYLWCRHVIGAELDPHQLAWIQWLEREASCQLVGSRRIRKSFTVAMFLLKEAACKPWSEVNIHAPAQAQSKRNLKVMADHIVASPLLSAYIERRIGEGIGREYVEFANKSLIQAQGQATSTDGLGATHQWCDEFDDMNWDIWLTRIFPTGSQIKPGHPYDNLIHGCRRVVTGTIKGEGNLYRLEHPDQGAKIRFTILPKLDCWDGIAMGIIPEDDILMMRETMTPAQFARTYLALYVESQDYFPSRLVASCRDPDVLVASIEGSRYQARGRVRVGMDFEGRGSGEEASRTAISFTESVGDVEWIYGKEWPPGSDPSAIRDEVCELIEFFRPVGGFGDAYGAAELFEINAELHRRGISKNDPSKTENREGADGWDQWFIVPIRFEGRTKDRMYNKLRVMMSRASGSGRLAFPVPVDGYEPHAFLARCLAQFENIKAARCGGGYDAFRLIRKALGNDLLDATAASIWGHDANKKSSVGRGGAARMGGFKGRPRFARPDFKNQSLGGRKR